MTRLHEALERAHAMAGGQPAGSAAPGATEESPAVEMPQAWQFDIDEPVVGAASASDRVSERQEAAASEAATVVTPYAFLNERNADKLIVGPAPNAFFVEQYRRLAAALHHAQLQSGARTVMVASAIESEGKTLTAANLALTLSHSYERKVLIIDADLRRPSQHNLFGLSNREGLGDVLRALDAPARLPVQRVSPNLWVMTAGRPTSDPMSGLVSDTMRNLLLEASQEFDWVVVDTPPVALLTDANILARMIDVALLVVNASTTPYPLVRRAVDAIGQERVLGVVLNRAEERETAPGYYSYAYAYAYGPKMNQRRRWYHFGRRRPRKDF